MVNAWYKGFFEYLEKKHVENTKELLNDPRRVFYADESGFPRCVKSGNAFAPV